MSNFSDSKYSYTLRECDGCGKEAWCDNYMHLCQPCRVKEDAKPVDLKLGFAEQPKADTPRTQSINET